MAVQNVLAAGAELQQLDLQDTHLDRRSMRTKNPMAIPPAENASLEAVSYNMDGRSYNMTRVNGVHMLPLADFSEISDLCIKDCVKFAVSNQISRVVIADTIPANCIVSLCKAFTTAGIEVTYIDHHSDEYLGNPNKRGLETNHQRLMTMNGVETIISDRHNAPTVSELMEEGCLVDNNIGMYICCPPDLDALLSGLNGCGLNVSRLCYDNSTEANLNQMLGRLDSPNAVKRDNTETSAWVEPFAECLSLPRNQADWADLTMVYAGAIKEGGLSDDSKEGPFTEELFKRSNLAMTRVDVLTALIIDGTTQSGKSIFTPVQTGSSVLVHNLRNVGENLTEIKANIDYCLQRHGISIRGKEQKRLNDEVKYLISTKAADRQWTRVEIEKALVARCKKLGQMPDSNIGSYVFARNSFGENRVICQIFPTGCYKLGSRRGDGGINFKEIEAKTKIRCGGLIGRQGVISMELPDDIEERKLALEKFNSDVRTVIAEVARRVNEIDRKK